MSWTVHPVLVPASEETVAEWASERGQTFEAAAVELAKLREKRIALERADPFKHEWEPDTWKIADAVHGVPLYDRLFERRLAEKGWTWEAFCARVRKWLGFDPERARPMLLVMGTNRSAKSSRAAKRMMEALVYRKDIEAFFFDMHGERSKMEQQKMVWRYMPKGLRDAMRRTDTNVQYNSKNGFSGDAFVLPNGSRGRFNTYTQDLLKVSEGTQPHRLWMDELAPEDWVRVWSYRLATHSGLGEVSFTPLQGWSPTVAMICAGGEVTWDVPAYLLPMDGGEPAPYAALGLTRDEWLEVKSARESKPARQAWAPETGGMDAIRWADMGPAEYEAWELATKWPELKGRAFRRAPRAMRSQHPKWSVVWFQAMDNPFGGIHNVIEEAFAAGKGTDEIRKRCYGWVDKTGTGTLRKFAKHPHVVPASAVPRDGETVLMVDPHPKRNWAMAWFVTDGQRHWLKREWPSQTERIPEIGLAEPWALPSGRLADGEMGEGQRSFGFGLGRIKFEIARLEGWVDYDRWLGERCQEEGVKPAVGAEMVLSGRWYPGEGVLRGWDDRHGNRERVVLRMMDPRACEATQTGWATQTSLRLELADIGLRFVPARGGPSAEKGLEKVASLLDFEGVGEAYLSAPHLFVSDRCRNAIFALENWRGDDGERGATKDWIDLVRWYAMLATGLEWGSLTGADVAEERVAEDAEYVAPHRGRLARLRGGDVDEGGWEVEV